MSGRGLFFVWAVILVGFTCLGDALRQFALHPPGSQWLVVVLLTLVSGTATVKLPSIPAHISVSETFLFSAVLLFGPAPGVLTVVLDALIAVIKAARRVRKREQIIFNLAAPALSLWVAAHLFYATAKIQPLAEQNQAVHIGALVGPLLLFTLTYFSLNSGLVAMAVGFQKRISPFAVWREHLMWLSLNYFGGASVAALMVVYTRQLDWTYLGVTLPLLLVLYMTFRTTWRELLTRTVMLKR
jgi:hypothetical protein